MHGKTPNQVWDRESGIEADGQSGIVRFALAAVHRPVKVRSMAFATKDLFWQYDMGHLWGEEVILRVDDADLSRVSVWTLDGKFACAWRGRTGWFRPTRSGIAERGDQGTRALRKRYATPPARLRIHEDIPETMFRLQQERTLPVGEASRPPTPTPTPTIVPIRSPWKGSCRSFKGRWKR